MKLSTRMRLKLKKSKSYPLFKYREKKQFYFKNKYLQYLYNALCELFLSLH